MSIFETISYFLANRLKKLVMPFQRQLFN